VRAAKYIDKDYHHKTGRLGQSSNVLVFKHCHTLDPTGLSNSNMLTVRWKGPKEPIVRKWVCGGKDIRETGLYTWQFVKAVLKTWEDAKPVQLHFDIFLS